MGLGIRMNLDITDNVNRQGESMELSIPYKSALSSYEGDNFKDSSPYALIQLAKFYECLLMRKAHWWTILFCVS